MATPDRPKGKPEVAPAVNQPVENDKAILDRTADNAAAVAAAVSRG